MTIGGWLFFALISVLVGVVWFLVFVDAERKLWKVVVSILTVLVIAGMLFGLLWYFQNTEPGRRQLTSQKSEYGGGLERTVTVYTADGTVLAQYRGRFDIEKNNGGYILFDFEGKRYIYYNCFVESIAEIE